MILLSKYYFWELPPCLWKFCFDKIIKRCVLEHEHESILSFCYELACRGHLGLKRTARIFLESGLYWNYFLSILMLIVNHVQSVKELVHCEMLLQLILNMKS